MLLNRIILFILIIASGIFATFYGGNVSYAFFYMTIFVPVISFLYTFYVYVRFRLFQEIGQRVVVKGDMTYYAFTIANEDYITFRSVKVNFLHDKSTITNAESIQEYCLLPNASETLHTTLRCNYRGEYYVGASSIDITDFLYLFKITYPIRSKLKVTVLPRVVPIGRLNMAPPQKDVKQAPFLFHQEKESMDIETRKYDMGDNLKQVHWKVTAKRNELFSRKFNSNPKTEMVILMDLTPIDSDNLTSIIIEDQILEGTLALANYCKDNNTKAKIYYEQDGLKTISIRSKMDFDMFYRLCVDIRFNAKMSIDQVLSESTDYIYDNNFYIIITHNLTLDLYKRMLPISEKGNDITVLLVCDKLNQDQEDILFSLKLAGISYRHITREDEIGEVLNS
ncbi:MAG: hypothetical protein K0S41_531 [Anaerocolumna sp.]|jgi:uncharacterized protein (DUF58 family)|nr:hypothetical protein [Anaerocolumna sp.]